MLKRRIIPIILIKEGQIVQSKGFSRHQFIGDPIKSVERYSEWNADEIIYLNISPNHDYSSNHREDINTINYTDFSSLIDKIAAKNFCPITVGGGIKTMEMVDSLFKSGADKLSFCSSFVHGDYKLINYTRERYGDQAVVIVLDVIKIEGGYFIYDYTTGNRTDISLIQALNTAENIGVGEILIQDVLSDGRKQGFDIELFNWAARATTLPIIALGGAGSPDHFFELFSSTEVDAAAAANYFQHTELSIKHTRNELKINKQLNYIR